MDFFFAKDDRYTYAALPWMNEKFFVYILDPPMRLDGNQLLSYNKSNFFPRSVLYFKKDSTTKIWCFLGEPKENRRHVSSPLITNDSDATVTDIYLGQVKERCYYARIETSVVGPGEWIRISPIILALIQEDWHADLIGRANALLTWIDRSNWCSICGSKTTLKNRNLAIKTCENVKCEASQEKRAPINIRYPRSDTSVVVLLLSHCNNHCLLVRGHHYPKGFYAAVAGFIDPGESLETAAKREVWEETGIALRESRLVYYKSLYWPFPATLMAGFYATLPKDVLPGSKITPIDSDEIDGYIWLSRDQVSDLLITKRGPISIPQQLSLVSHMLKKWISAKSAHI